MDISGTTRLTGFFARPAKHTISPSMHNLSFQKLGIDAVYLAFDAGKEDMEQAVSSIRTLNMLGANLSMPNKQIGAALMDELSPAATLIGAINTIVNRDGKLYGYNTDGEGFMRSAKENGIDPVGKKMTVIGGGGAATAIIAQAALDGVAEIAVFNLKDSYYAAVAEKLAEIAATTKARITLNDLKDTPLVNEAIATSVLLVNATGVGMKPLEGQMAIEDTTSFHKNLAVIDIIYSPRETELLKQAKKAGCQTLNGLGMLLYQGAAAFKLWTGQEMPVDEVRTMMEKQ